jgi:hypothetical protein
MAKIVTTHSKYKDVIVSKTDMRKLKKGLQRKMSDIVTHLVKQLTYIGEECIRIARENGSYNDITGNLRSSIGYVVLLDGKPVIQGKPKQYKGKNGNGSDGAPAADALLKKLQAKFPWGVVLIVCAGMNYAAYVEAIHHKDVLTSAELRAEQLAKKLLKGLTEAK